MKKKRTTGFFIGKKKLKKTLLTMKFILFFIALTAFSASGAGYSQRQLQKLSFELNQATLKEILKEIEKKSDFKFLFTDDAINVSERIDYVVNDETIHDALKKVLGNNNLKYTLLEDNLIVITPSAVKQDGKLISGTIRDGETGEVLPGVNVVIKGSRKGTITDMDGNFELAVSDPEAVLVLSYVGYLSEEMPVAGKSQIDIQLTPDLLKVDEVVVVGYGVQRKKVVTGSIASVSSDDIEKVASVGIDQVLQGRAPGVHVSQNSNAPGGAVTVRIRGVHSTTGGNEPLYVIDGVPVRNDNLRSDTQNGGEISGPLNSINPADIESIQILKDGAAAIYGTRAAAGVVLITTKRGAKGKGNISFDAYYGVQELDKKLEMTNAQQYVELYNQILDNSGYAIDPDYENPSIFTESTDWQDAIMTKAPIQNYNLSFSGGGQNSTYYISANYFKQDGIIEGSSFERFGVRVNTDNNITNRLKIGNSLSLSRTHDDFVHTNDIYHGVVISALRFSPLIPVYDSLGNYSAPTGTYSALLENPKAYAIEEQQDFVTNRAIGNLYAEYDLLPALTYKLSTGFDFSYADQERFHPREMQGFLNQKSDLSRFKKEHYELLAENTLTYAKSINNHNINVVAGTSLQEFRGNHISVSAEVLNNDNVYFLRNYLVDTTRRGDGWINEEVGFVSFYGRVMYSYEDKYLLTASLRRDGSTRFGPKNKFGNFPYISVGWNIAEESFMSPFSNLISDAKIRASYARLGSAEIGNFEYLSRMDGTDSYPFNNSFHQALYSKKAPNPSLQWESSESMNFGIDLSFINNKLLFTTEYYIKNTKDMLINVPLPKMLGVEEDPRLNAGKIQNKGMEFNLIYRKYEGDLKYDISANFSTISNEVTDLGGPEKSVQISEGYATTRTQEGSPVGSFYGYVYEGIFNSYDEMRNAAIMTGASPFDEETGELLSESKLNRKAAPGDIRYADLSGPDGVPDGIIDSYDRTIIGNPFPDFYYGFSGNIRYKGFDLNYLFEGVKGNDVMNSSLYASRSMNGLHNMTLNVYENHWTPENMDTDVPRPVANDPNQNRAFSSRWLEDGSYFRLKSIQFGYTIPTSLTNSIGMQQLRIYVSAKNLMTITDYSGYDPDIGAIRRDPLKSGIDKGAYPLAKSYMFGLNVKF